ncbi:Caspase domain containing protein [Lactarius tabidus]
MGNFVSSSCSASSRPTTTPPASPSYHNDRTTLTSALTAHTTRFAHLFRDRIHLDDIEEGLSLPADDTKTRVPHADADVLDGRRRVLLIGIAYHGELLNTNKDVDRYRDLLLGTYGYRAEDVVVLKDDLALRAQLQPTRENILRELRHLVADAAPGDRFTFLYFGHSNQQRSKGLNEEDFKDECLITIDDEIIVDNELNDILVKPLPAGSSLFALLDTCDSGTLQNLPHYHCNVPWRSNGKRRTKSWQNQNVTVRRNAALTVMQDPVSSEADASCLWTAIGNILAWRRPSAPPKVRSVLPIFAFSDSGHQRTWEAYDSSLTRIACNCLEQNRLPSYKELMMHINYRLHATSPGLLHEWTRSEEKAAAAVRDYAYGEDEKKRARCAELDGEAVVCGC